MTTHRRRRLTLAGGCVLAFAVAVGAVGCGTSMAELESGQCITGDVEMYPPQNIQVIDCSEADPIMDYEVMFTEKATGNSYPGNISSITSRCQGQGGRVLPPSSSTWEQGDRWVLCSETPPIGSFDGGY